MAKARKANDVHTRDAKEYQRLRDQARMWGGSNGESPRPGRAQARQ